MEESFLHCLVRKKRVISSPEEIVRQRLLSLMIQHLGFPSSSLLVEVAVKSMPHLKLSNLVIPLRRVDLLCYSNKMKKNRSLHPLLLVECKAIKLTSAMLRQVIGYNHYIGARFISIANAEEIRTGWYHPLKRNYHFINGLPHYQELILAANDKE